MQTYTFADMQDKTVDGIRKEVESGLATIAVYFHTTFGLPLEYFSSQIEERCPTNPDKVIFYMNFRNLHPELFN